MCLIDWIHEFETMKNRLVKRNFKNYWQFQNTHLHVNAWNKQACKILYYDDKVQSYMQHNPGQLPYNVLTKNSTFLYFVL